MNVGDGTHSSAKGTACAKALGRQPRSLAETERGPEWLSRVKGRGRERLQAGSDSSGAGAWSGDS